MAFMGYISWNWISSNKLLFFWLIKRLCGEWRLLTFYREWTVDVMLVANMQLVSIIIIIIIILWKSSPFWKKREEPELVQKKGEMKWCQKQKDVNDNEIHYHHFNDHDHLLYRKRKMTWPK